MPYKKESLAILVLALITGAALLPAAVSAEPGIGQWLSTSTTVSGQVVVNETVTLKTVSYGGGLVEKDEWTLQNTLQDTSGSTWRSTLWFGTSENSVPAVRYERTGFLSPFLYRR
ncbi:MAG: hypothetical protein LUQ01_01895 [Methanolinea sp.]|nr:hypothetical protein [Methanolinea sp.]